MDTEQRERWSPSCEYAFHASTHCTYTDLQHTTERTICHRPPHESRMHTTEHKASHTKLTLSHLLLWLFGTFKTPMKRKGKKKFLERSYFWHFLFFVCFILHGNLKHGSRCIFQCSRQFEVSATKVSDLLHKFKYDCEMQIPEASACCGWNVWSGVWLNDSRHTPSPTANVPVTICALLFIYHNSRQGTGANTRNKQKNNKKCRSLSQQHPNTGPVNWGSA